MFDPISIEEQPKTLFLDSRGKAMDATRTELTQSHLAQPTPSDSPDSNSAPRGELLATLRQRIRHLETASRSHLTESSAVSMGCGVLDQLLPENGLLPGTITEWFSAMPGQGAEVLSLIAAREACRSGDRDGRALVVVDDSHSFYPPAAQAWAINLRNTIVLRPLDRRIRKHNSPRSRHAQPSRDLLWAIEQALRCPAVAAVWGSLDWIDERWFRRFQLSAEESGAMGMFVRPQEAQGDPSWSEVQWLVSGAGIASRPGSLPQTKNVSSARRSRAAGDQESLDRFVHLQLLRCRGGHAGKRVRLKIDFSTGDLGGVMERARLQSIPAQQPVTPLVTRVQDVEQHDQPASTVHLAAQLARPAISRREQSQRDRSERA